MQEVIVIAEGQTEEVFIKRVVAPIFHSQQIFLKPVLMKTSATAKGGAVTFDRLKLNIRNEIRRNQNIKLTTFLDLYGLDTSFPDFNQAQSIQDVYLRVEHLEQAAIYSLFSRRFCVCCFIDSKLHCAGICLKSVSFPKLLKKFGLWSVFFVSFLL